MDNQTVAHPYNRVLFSDKKKWALEPQKGMVKPQIHITKWKKPVWKSYIPPVWFQLHDFPEKQN